MAGRKEKLKFDAKAEVKVRVSEKAALIEALEAEVRRLEGLLKGRAARRGARRSEEAHGAGGPAQGALRAPQQGE